ncbi:eukaryotic translation elongation factor 1 epsilon-1 isoform X2 [Microtus ochrogaster]|uniref:Eukaryotic translation elongation factor 1 epsilon-1 isoform X2 n=1 Tax=Microtus ochrogaster TaxID=79684 RepID=A0ABM0KY49_MICOH|nr:eukaryotic translation elongation factor 1 epsilon-1 isoform X2 [Microtus ochrogaster]
MAAAAELKLLEKSLGLRPGNKYSAQGERQVPVLQTNNGPSLMGLATIATHLVKLANKEHLLGSTPEEKAIVQQWLEYRVTRVDGHSSKEDTHTLLKVDLTVQEKESYLNVSRWFCHIQHYPDIRQHLSSVVFIKNRLYANSH